MIASLLSGALIEITAVYWTHHAERGNTINTALLSALQALVLIYGVRDWAHAPWFVVGYALGAFVAVKIKGRRP